MSKEDKKKLDGVAEGANRTIVDSVLSDSSTNPLQNKIVKAELEKKLSASLKGVINGVAELDASGKVPSSQLPATWMTLSTAGPTGIRKKIKSVCTATVQRRWKLRTGKTGKFM